MLALQSQGKGQRDAAGYAGMMNLALNPLQNAWGEMEEELSLFEISLGEEIICENIEEEKQLTIDKGNVTCHGEKVGISCAGDMRWDQWAYGWAYNSNSGTTLLCGNLSKKCVGIECMSKRCAECEPREKMAKENANFCKVTTAAEACYFS
jgi:hypothetical protein